MLALLILVGPRGVGKSTVRAELARDLGWPSASPDDFEDGWEGVTRMLWQFDRAIVECCRVPALLVETIGPATTLVRLNVPSRILAQRLAQRRDIAGEDIPRLLEEALDTRASYHARLTPDLVLTTDAEPASLAALIIRHLEALPWVSSQMPLSLPSEARDDHVLSGPLPRRGAGGSRRMGASR